MKKLFISLGLVMALVVALTIPAIGATQKAATVTVPSYINFSVTDNGATTGITFGSLNPGLTDQAEKEQAPVGAGGAVTLTVFAETNSDLNIQTKGADFNINRASGTATGGSTTTLVDSNAGFIAAGVQVGDIITNRTTGAVGTVTEVTDLHTLTVVSFTGGTTPADSRVEDNDFANGDLYAVRAGSPTSTITIGNAKWDINSNVDGATVMTTSYATVGTSTHAVQSVVQLYHWISVPNGQAPGTYTGLFSYQTAAQ